MHQRKYFELVNILSAEDFFLEGIFYDAQNHQYLTRTTNQFIELVASISSCYEGNKKGSFQNFIENSHPVPESRILSNQIVRDFIAFAK
jgi:hypothetical protein